MVAGQPGGLAARPRSSTRSMPASASGSSTDRPRLERALVVPARVGEGEALAAASPARTDASKARRSSRAADQW